VNFQSAAYQAGYISSSIITHYAMDMHQ